MKSVTLWRGPLVVTGIPETRAQLERHSAGSLVLGVVLVAHAHVGRHGAVEDAAVRVPAVQCQADGLVRERRKLLLDGLAGGLDLDLDRPDVRGTDAPLTGVSIVYSASRPGVRSLE